MAIDDNDTIASDRKSGDLEVASPGEVKDGCCDGQFCNVNLNDSSEQVGPDSKLSTINHENETLEDDITEKFRSVNSETLELPAPESSKLDISPEKKSVKLPSSLSEAACSVTAQPLKSEGSNRKSKPGLVRHIMALLALSSIVLANMNRQAFNQALVSMTKPVPEQSADPAGEPELGSNSDPKMLGISNFTTNAPSFGELDLPGTVPVLISPTNDLDHDDRFDWTGAQIGTLQAAFSYGYAPFMIPGGRMSEIYGAKWVVFASGFGSALCCILAPFLADTNYALLVASRVIMGLSQTGISPGLYALLTRWLPPDESSVYLPMIKVAVMLGFMSGSLVSGFFTWRVTFYLVGLIGLFWSIMWAFLASSDPRENKLISEKELDYIQHEIRLLNKGRALSAGSSRKKSAPWLSILTNPVVIGFMLTKFTVKLSTDSQSMQIPMYLKNVFQVSSELNGILSATNFAIQGIFTGLVAWLAKELVVRKSYGLNKTGVRRIFQGINNFGMGFGYILMTFNTSLTMVCGSVVLLSVSSMFGAGGEAVTPVDLSIEYSASIMAIANSLANTSGIVLPKIVSFILDNQLDNSERWSIVWWIVGGLTITGGFIYTCMVKAEIQDFDEGTKQTDKIGDGLSKATNSQNSSTFIEMTAPNKSKD